MQTNMVTPPQSKFTEETTGDGGVTIIRRSKVVKRGKISGVYAGESWVEHKETFKGFPPGVARKKGEGSCPQSSCQGLGGRLWGKNHSDWEGKYGETNLIRGLKGREGSAIAQAEDAEEKVSETVLEILRDVTTI